MHLETLLCDREDGIATVTLNRPHALNAFDNVMKRELADLIPVLAEDQEVRCIILTGAGRAFCAGGDLKDMVAPIPRRWPGATGCARCC